MMSFLFRSFSGKKVTLARAFRALILPPPLGPTVGSSWDTTKPNSTATGQCHSGYFSPSNPQRFCNPNGTWGKIENDCVDNPLGQAADWLPFVISGVLGAASVITYFFARKRNPAAQNYLILGTGFSLVELFTDCLFLLQTSMLIGSFDSFSFFLLLVMFIILMPFFLSFFYFFIFSQSSYLFFASLTALLLSMIMNMVMMLSLLTPEIKRLASLIYWPTVILLNCSFSSCSSF